MFELKTITECELTAFTGHTRKEGKDDIPAVSIRLRIKGVPNEELDKFSSTLRPTIYMAVPGQEDLPGMPPSTPLLRSKDVTHLPTEFRYEGWKVWIARGMNDDALHMEQCKVDAFSFDFYEGGKMDYEFRISTADLDEEGAGMLWGRQKRKVFVRIEAPELPAAGERTEATGAEIDGSEGHPGAADERFEQHVAGAQFEPRAAGGGMKPGDRQRPAGLDLAGDAFIVDRALGFQRDDGCGGLGLVAILDRGLQRAEFGGVHHCSPGLSCVGGVNA